VEANNSVIVRPIPVLAPVIRTAFGAVVVMALAASRLRNLTEDSTIERRESTDNGTPLGGSHAVGHHSPDHRRLPALPDGWARQALANHERHAMTSIIPSSLVAATLWLGFGGVPARVPTPGPSRPTASVSPTRAEIDSKLWAAVSAAVANHDIVALGRTYHPAAVLVSSTGTKPIAQALAEWGKDMAAAKKAGTRASVAFRFAQRQDDAETAFQSGIFRYATTTRAGVETPVHIRFEALLVKSSGTWLMLMERQLDTVSEQEWAALK